LSPVLRDVISGSVGGTHFEYALPAGDGPFSLIILLHGWTGDEKSMWVFASRMPRNCILLAPRGLFVSMMGGYSWFPDDAGSWPDIDDFIPAFNLLHNLMEAEFLRDNWDGQTISLVGFSQGAALAYGFSVQPTSRIKSIAGLSGFVPNGILKFVYSKPLSGIPLFVTHGMRDKIVPIERGRNGVSVLQELGAIVTYCEDDSGHRLSPTCFKGLQKFFQPD